VPKVRISENQPIVRIKVPDCRQDRCRLDARKLPPYIEGKIDWELYVRKLGEGETTSMKWTELPTPQPVYIDMYPGASFGSAIAYYVRGNAVSGFEYAVRQIRPFRTGKDVEANIPLWSIPYAINIAGHTRQVIYNENAIVYWVDSTEDTLWFFHRGAKLEDAKEKSLCDITDPDQRKAVELMIRDYPTLLNKYGFTYKCKSRKEIDKSLFKRGNVGFGADNEGDEQGKSLRELNRGDPSNTETPENRSDVSDRDEDLSDISELEVVKSSINRVQRTGDPICGQKIRGWVPGELADQPNSVFDEKISRWMEVGLDMNEFKRLGAGQGAKEDSLFTKENISSNMNLADIQFRPGAVISRPKGMFAGKEFDF